MHSLNNRGVHTENLRILPNSDTNNMDYRQNMIVPTSEKLKLEEDDDDEDLETLRLAALKSLRSNNTLRINQKTSQLTTQQNKVRVANYSNCNVYGNRRSGSRGYYQNRVSRQNGNVYHQSRSNQNLIEIVPMEEDQGMHKDHSRSDPKIVNNDTRDNRDTEGDSKFRRYTDNASGSEEEDTKESNSTSTTTALLTSRSDNIDRELDGEESGTEKDVHSGLEESPREVLIANEVRGDEEELEVEEEEVQEEEEADEEEEEAAAEEDDEEEEEEDDEEESSSKPQNEDDDDVLLMADFEEEDSLERLMDEMEREINVDKIPEKKEKKSNRKETRDTIKIDENRSKLKKSRLIERKTEKNGLSTLSTLPIKSNTDILRPLSPRPQIRLQQKRRSISPKIRGRKKSPRRSSPRRSPTRQSKKLTLTRRLSPRRSPIRSPMRKLSPRGRSRSPKRSIRSRSPRNPRSPRLSPMRLSPRGRSPLRTRSPIRPRSPQLRQRTPNRSPQHKNSPLRRSSPRNRSPRLSPRRGISPRSRSPIKLSPDRRRNSPTKNRTPTRNSPHRSSPPWNSPRNSPRLSPRRRRSPKDNTRKLRPVSPDDTKIYKRDEEMIIMTTEQQKNKIKTTNLGNKDIEISNNPILEARRRKFESTKLIDPVNDNKKIKLSKRDCNNSDKNIETNDNDDDDNETTESCGDDRKIVDDDNYDIDESDLCLTQDYVYEVLEDSDIIDADDNNETMQCVEIVTVKNDKIRSKKKKKRDKELYQVGKHKSELPLSERIGKEKKCKKRKDRNNSTVESSPEISGVNNVEDLTVDEEGDLRTELSRRRAERLNRSVPVQSARLLQSAFKGVVKEVAKTNAKAIQRHAIKLDDKVNKKEVRRVTVLHRPVTDLPDSEEEVLDSKVPVRFRLGLNKSVVQDSSSSSSISNRVGGVDANKVSRKSSKRQGRKVKHKSNISLSDHDRKNQ